MDLHPTPALAALVEGLILQMFDVPRQERQRFRARRKSPSLERTTRARASAVKVLWPSAARSNWARMNLKLGADPASYPPSEMALDPKELE